MDIKYLSFPISVIAYHIMIIKDIAATIILKGIKIPIKKRKRISICRILSQKFSDSLYFHASICLESQKWQTMFREN